MTSEAPVQPLPFDVPPALIEGIQVCRSEETQILAQRMQRPEGKGNG